MTLCLIEEGDLLIIMWLCWTKVPFSIVIFPIRWKKAASSWLASCFACWIRAELASKVDFVVQPVLLVLAWGRWCWCTEFLIVKWKGDGNTSSCCSISKFPYTVDNVDMDVNKDCLIRHIHRGNNTLTGRGTSSKGLFAKKNYTYLQMKSPWGSDSGGHI